MPIDTNILLQGRVPDAGAAFGKGFNIGQSIHDTPLRSKLFEAQTQGQNLQNKAAQQKFTQEEKLFQLGDMAQDAMMIKPMIESGDLMRTNVALAERIKKIQDRGGNPSDTIALRDRLNSGDVQGAVGELDTVINTASKLGILKDNSLEQQRLDQQKKYYDYLISKGEAPADPYYSVVDTTQGKMIFNNRSGKFEIAAGADGKPLLSAAVDPENKREVSAAGAFGTAQGKGDAAAISDLGGVINTAETALDRLDKLRQHPGRSYAIGLASKLPVVPGTDQQDFVTRLDELKGGAFLQAFMSLKGGGQITEKEGEKAEAAIQRMNRALSGKDFDAALDDYETIIAKGLAKARRSANAAAGRQGQEMPNGPVPPVPGQAATPENMQPIIQEGATATNPQTGQKIIFRGGQWQPL